MIQETVWLVSLSLMAVVAAAFIYVTVNSSKTIPEYEEAQARALSFRAKLFWLMLAAGVIIFIATTQVLPYAATRGEVVVGAVEIDAVGKQWFWELSQNEVEAGTTVIFNVTTEDVNHGMGIYDGELRLLAQTQAMPGYENKLKFTFSEPGQYRLMCMEYCGLSHHAMIIPFNVK